MTYELADGLTRCGACDTAIPRGMPLYIVTAARLPRCAACANGLGVSLPAIHSIKTFSKPEFGRFDRAKISTALKQNVLDAKTRQVGSE